MQLIRDAKNVNVNGTVVSIGMFDGVHTGHRRVLHSLRATGQMRGLATVVVTFDPHPRAVLHPQSPPELLVSLEDRIELLELTGMVDHCLVLPFDRQASQVSAPDFVQHTLVEHLGMRALIVGENFRCGRARAGDIELLRSLGIVHGFTVHPVTMRLPSESSDNLPCSSTEMRRLISSGDIVRAAMGLTRPHEMSGTVSRTSAHADCVDEVTLQNGMCAPAAADYTGAVRNKLSASQWVPALLQVRHQDDRRRTVRLMASHDLPFARGDVLALRFLNRAHPDA
jgi:riboflavin kinase/FMN adenylyltransferase